MLLDRHGVKPGLSQQFSYLLPNLLNQNCGPQLRVQEPLIIVTDTDTIQPTFHTLL